MPTGHYFLPQELEVVNPNKHQHLFRISFYTNQLLQDQLTPPNFLPDLYSQHLQYPKPNQRRWPSRYDTSSRVRAHYSFGF